MQLWETVVQLIIVLSQLVVQLLQLALANALLIAFVAWCLCGINWKKMWPTLAAGAWAPVVLLMLVSALAWSSIAPSSCTCLAIVTVPNFWWQLGSIGLLAAVALLCGWLQGIFGWTPAEFILEPATAHHDEPGQHHGQEHDHGHLPTPSHSHPPRPGHH